MTALLILALYLVLALAVAAILWWMLRQFTLPEPLRIGANVVLGIFGIIFLLWWGAQAIRLIPRLD